MALFFFFNFFYLLFFYLSYKNIKIIDNENCVLNHKEEVKLKFGLGEYFLNQSNKQANINLKINVDKKLKEPIIIEYNLDKSNNVLVDNININAKDNTKANMSREQLARQLQLLGINMDRTSILRIEKSEVLLKDFELIAIVKILGIDYHELEKFI